MVIDFHTHAFPDALAARAVPSLAARSGITAYTNGTIADLQRSMDESGITHAVLCNIAVKPGQSRNVHSFAKSLLGHPSVIPLSSIHPLEPDWKTLLREIAADGIVGIKLHPDYQDFFINDPKMEAFYKEVFRLGLMILFHAGVDAGYPSPVHATPERIADILPVLTQGTVVLAHMGGYECEAGALAHLCGKGMYFDTSYNLNLMPPETAREIIRRNTPDYMLFGTDSPWVEQAAGLAYFKDSIAAGFLSAEDSERILFANGAKLLGLSSNCYEIGAKYSEKRRINHDK